MLPCPRLGVKPERNVCRGRRVRGVEESSLCRDDKDEADGKGGVDTCRGSSQIIAATGTLLGSESSGRGRFFPIVLVVARDSSRSFGDLASKCRSFVKTEGTLLTGGFASLSDGRVQRLNFEGVPFVGMTSLMGKIGVEVCTSTFADVVGGVELLCPTGDGDSEAASSFLRRF